MNLASLLFTDLTPAFWIRRRQIGHGKASLTSSCFSQSQQYRYKSEPISSDLGADSSAFISAWTALHCSYESGLLLWDLSSLVHTPVVTQSTMPLGLPL